LLQHEPLTALESLTQPGEGDRERHPGLGGDEGVLLREPGRAAVELDRAHLPGQDTGQTEQPRTAGGREVGEGEGLPGEHPRPGGGDPAEQPAEPARCGRRATGGGRGAQLRRHRDVVGAEEELAGLAVDGLPRDQGADGHLRGRAEQFDGQRHGVLGGVGERWARQRECSEHVLDRRAAVNDPSSISAVDDPLPMTGCR